MLQSIGKMHLLTVPVTRYRAGELGAGFRGEPSKAGDPTSITALTGPSWECRVNLGASQKSIESHVERQPRMILNSFRGMPTAQRGKEDLPKYSDVHSFWGTKVIRLVPQPHSRQHSPPSSSYYRLSRRKAIYIDEWTILHVGKFDVLRNQQITAVSAHL